jgi:hypothetical protein
MKKSFIFVTNLKYKIMKKAEFQNKNRTEFMSAVSEVLNKIESDDLLVVDINTFYDSVDDLWRGVISYH